MHAQDTAKQTEIAAEVREIADGLRAHVVDIATEFGADWTGDPAVFFHVVLRDSATRGRMLGNVTAEVRKRLSEMLRRVDAPFIGYPDFRSESEAAEVQQG